MMYPAIAPVEQAWKTLCRIGGWAASILLIYCVLTMFILVRFGGVPETAQDCFAMIQKNVMVALLRLDVLTILVMPVFCLLYAGLYAALRQECGLTALSSWAAATMGVVLILANTSAASLVYLSNQYLAATTDSRRALLLAAGEALISNDMWHGTAAKMGGIMLQLAGVLISVVMLRTAIFSKLIAYSGLVAHGLDLTHILIGFFAPKAAVVAMAIAGPLYLMWFPLVAKRLHQLGRQCD